MLVTVPAGGRGTIERSSRQILPQGILRSSLGKAIRSPRDAPRLPGWHWWPSGSQIGLMGENGNIWFRPTCKVLPMGWSSSAGIMQAASREILLSKGLPHLELERGSSIPAWFTR